jgi:hypothetical protein
MKRLATTVLFCAAALVAAGAARAACAPGKPPPPGQRGWLIVNRREIAACGRAGGKVSIIAHMRYCSVAFVQDREPANSTKHSGD